LGYVALWNGRLHEMWVEVEEAGFGVVDVLDAAEIQGHVVFASSDAYVLLYAEELLDLQEILRLDVIEPQSQRYQNEDGVALVDDLFDFIQEDIAIQTNINLQFLNRIRLLIKISQNEGDHLWAVPLSWTNVDTLRLVADAVDAERAIVVGQTAVLGAWAVVHELAEQLEIPLAEILIIEHIQFEMFTKQVPLHSLKQDHLPCPEHASPTRIRLQLGANKRYLYIISVREPRHTFKCN